MSAKVDLMVQGERALAVCDECEAAFGATPTLARNWAYVHNELHHNGEGSQ